MALSLEALIAVITLIVTGPPALLCFWQLIRPRQYNANPGRESNQLRLPRQTMDSLEN